MPHSVGDNVNLADPSRFHRTKRQRQSHTSLVLCFPIYHFIAIFICSHTMQFRLGTYLFPSYYSSSLSFFPLFLCQKPKQNPKPHQNARVITLSLGANQWSYNLQLIFEWYMFALHIYHHRIKLIRAVIHPNTYTHTHTYLYTGTLMHTIPMLSASNWE